MSMADDPVAAAEKRGYQRGYNAGKRRLVQEVARDRRHAQAEAFRRRAFLAALPAAFGAQGWKRGDQPITSMEDRVRLAWEVADEAMKRYR